MEEHWMEKVIGLHVLIMSCTRFRVNPHSIVAWMSRNSLLEVGAKSEVQVTATGHNHVVHKRTPNLLGLSPVAVTQGNWLFGNDFAKNVVIFGGDNFSSSHADIRKNKFLMLLLLKALLRQKKHLVLNLVNQKQNSARIYIIIKTIVICLLTDKKV